MGLHKYATVPGGWEYARIPGLFRRWEFERVIEPGIEIRIEEAGEASDGTRLYAVYQRAPEAVSRKAGPERACR